MVDKIVSDTYIIELTGPELDTVVQMLHMRMAEGGAVEHATSALRSLASQLPHVSSTPEHHGVYPDTIRAPSDATKFRGSYYKPK